MTHSWKPDDFAMVKIVAVSSDGNTVGIQRSGGSMDWVWTDALQPLPQPLTELERSVVESWVDWRVSADSTTGDGSTQFYNAVQAVDRCSHAARPQS